MYSVYTTNDGRESPNPEEVISRSASVFVAGRKFNETVLQSENSVNDTGNNPRNGSYVNAEGVADNLEKIPSSQESKSYK
ncbi:hypothetical protein DPMN_184847 [Dreissena polymorpha]|uniref:Uncharacterized protein n=1 Tax=Dreissena polymorpha TaxID=45954 RepID=A0A9D4I885_DREPO|nr:hypothetical protein DPMN_184847 [Dreissena polymorpha]